MITLYNPHTASFSRFVLRMFVDPASSARGQVGAGIALSMQTGRAVRLDPNQQSLMCGSLGRFNVPTAVG